MRRKLDSLVTRWTVRSADCIANTHPNRSLVENAKLLGESAGLCRAADELEALLESERTRRAKWTKTRKAKP